MTRVFFCTTEGLRRLMEINCGWAEPEIKSGRTFTVGYSLSPLGPLISFSHKVGESENVLSITIFDEIPIPLARHISEQASNFWASARDRRGPLQTSPGTDGRTDRRAVDLLMMAPTPTT